MNKSEVCVKLTRKNCKKVLGILEMFGEPVYSETRLSLKNGNHLNEGYPFVYWNGHYWVGSEDDKDLTLIKPRELRNILAKEHLKVGQTIIARINTRNGPIDYVTSFNYFHETGLSGANWVCLDSATRKITMCEGFFDNFLRYATDEEKALLEPKKEFLVDEFEEGEWYITKNGEIANYQKGGKSYGVAYPGIWWNNGCVFDNVRNWRKATESEVSEALKKECVKRYGKDWENVKIKENVIGGGAVNIGSFDVFVSKDTIWNKQGHLYHNGKWAEPLKEPETYTREVWVNHYSDREFYVHYDELSADMAIGGRGQGTKVKATLTYDIPMTKV